MVGDSRGIFILADVALPIIGADLLRHFRLLVDLGEMRILARKGGWSQQMVEPSGSGMFATIGVVADQPSYSNKGRANKSRRHVCRGGWCFTSHSGGTFLYTFSSHSGGTQQHLFSSARIGGLPQCSQQV